MSSRDEEELVALILRRLHFDSLVMDYTVRETHYREAVEEFTSHVQYRASGRDFSVRCESVRNLTAFPWSSCLSWWQRALSWLGYVPSKKRPFTAPTTLICSVSFVDGKWRQLIECGEPGRGAEGITGRRGIYGDKSLWGNIAMQVPTPRHFWESVGAAARYDLYTGTLDMPLEELLGEPGKTRVWRRGDWRVLTHEAAVPETVDHRKRICLDIYLDEKGFVRRIEDVNRIWHLTEEECSAIPGLGAWEDARQVVFSVAFDEVEEDKDSGAQMPLSIRVSRNDLTKKGADLEKFDQWNAEGRSDYEIGLLSYTIPAATYRVYDIAVDRETLRINPLLQNEDIELSFPEGIRLEGGEDGCAGASVGSSCCAR